MAEKYKHYYVSQSLVKNWSKDGKHVAWFDPVEEKSIPDGEIEGYFHSNLIDTSKAMEDKLRRIDKYFDRIIQVFLDGDVDCLKSKDLMSPREILMFQMFQSPQAIFSEDKMISMIKSSLGISHKHTALKKVEEEARTEDVKKALSDMMMFGVDLLGMEAVIIDAPEDSSFLLGSFPFVLLNPYFASAEPEKVPAFPAFEYWGAIIVLPLSPKRAICLYDPDTYTLLREDGKVTLTEEDMDTLNSATLYNSDYKKGVIHVSEEDYINKLYDNLPDKDFCRDRMNFLGDNLDEYPFSTNLSFLLVKEEAEKELKKREKDFLRPFVSVMVDYDEDHPKKSKNGSTKFYSNRIMEARKIFEEMNGNSQKQ